MGIKGLNKKFGEEAVVCVCFVVSDVDDVLSGVRLIIWRRWMCVCW